VVLLVVVLVVFGGRRGEIRAAAWGVGHGHGGDADVCGTGMEGDSLAVGDVVVRRQACGVMRSEVL